MKNFLDASKDYQGGDNFAKLLNDGLVILGADYHTELAHELGIIPATVQRWATGLATPLPGMQKVAIRIMRKKIEGARAASEGSGH